MILSKFTMATRLGLNLGNQLKNTSLGRPAKKTGCVSHGKKYLVQLYLSKGRNKVVIIGMILDIF